jgi:hypothetical protein
MGLINNDVYVCSNGAQNTGTYVSFATETLYISQAAYGLYPYMNPSSQVPSYNVRANYRVYWDCQCRMTGMSFIDLKSISVILTSDQLNTNMYSALYAALKLQYTNTTDVFEPVPVSPTGASGSSGSSGSSGASGESGASGPSGESGSSGASGPSGESGPSGPSGESGASGPSGASGESGASGPSGASGESGASGPSGPSGESGASGPSGPSGESGASGPSGESGPMQ